MPNAESVWDRRAMRNAVSEWYGMTTPMALRIESRDEEIAAYEAEHPEVPSVLWEYVNHPLRQLRMWAKHPHVDLLVWNSSSQSFRLIQDIRFKDAYPDVEAWHAAVLEVLRSPTMQVWVVFHEE
jgi:hypothetical protein